MNRTGLSLIILCVCFSMIVGCGGIGPPPGPTPRPNPSATNTNAPLATLSTGPTSGAPQVPGLVRTSLELYRNGKTYEILIGYAEGSAFFRATPHPALPDKVSQPPIRMAELKWYGDLDHDGETEFIVSIKDSGNYPVEEIRVYKYDAASDQYYVADFFGAASLAVKEYDDLDGDGNPELVTANFGFCYQCSTYARWGSALAILRFEKGKFIDVTTQFPALLQEDAEQLLKSTETNADLQRYGFITLASYYYDMYRLGRMEEATPVFKRVCRTVIKPNMDRGFDCEAYRQLLETMMQESYLHP